MRKDAREATGPRAPRRRGGAGAARGGGAETSASEGPQERPGPSLRDRASSRVTAPSAAACEPQPRKGGRVVRRKASHRGEAPAADAALEPSLGDKRASASPLPEVSAARSGGTGLMAAAPEGAAEGGFCAEDAREATGPRAPQGMGGAGAARGGGAERDGSGGPQERPGPHCTALSEDAPARGAAPGDGASEPLLCKGGREAPRRASRLGGAPAAGGADEEPMSVAEVRAAPPPRSAAARCGGAGA